MKVKTPRAGPSSACPTCFRDGERSAAQVMGSHLMAFECRCGKRWQTPIKSANAHGVFLDRLRQLAKPVRGD